MQHLTIVYPGEMPWLACFTLFSVVSSCLLTLLTSIKKSTQETDCVFIIYSLILLVIILIFRVRLNEMTLRLPVICERNVEIQISLCNIN